MNKTQCNVILQAMLENDNREWTAKDFQSGKYFVGYEASARMSELASRYPELFIVGKVGRFRTLKINLEQRELIDFLKKTLMEE